MRQADLQIGFPAPAERIVAAYPAAHLAPPRPGGVHDHGSLNQSILRFNSDDTVALLANAGKLPSPSRTSRPHGWAASTRFWVVLRGSA